MEHTEWVHLEATMDTQQVRLNWCFQRLSDLVAPTTLVKAELKKSRIFTIPDLPGSNMQEASHKASKRLMSGKEVVVTAEPAEEVIKEVDLMRPWQLLPPLL